MKVSEFLQECDNFAYSKEYFELYKEASELEVMYLYDDVFSEAAGTKQQTAQTIKTKEDGFIKKIWKNIVSILQRFWNWVSSFFKSDKQKKTVGLAAKVSAQAKGKGNFLKQMDEYQKMDDDIASKRNWLILDALKNIQYRHDGNLDDVYQGDIPVFRPNPDLKFRKATPSWIMEQLQKENLNEVQAKKGKTIVLTISIKDTPYPNAVSVRTIAKITRGIERVLDDVDEGDPYMRIEETCKVIRSHLTQEDFIDIEITNGFKNRFDSFLKNKDKIRDMLPDPNLVKSGPNPKANAKTLNLLTKTIGDTIKVNRAILDSFHNILIEINRSMGRLNKN